MQRFGAELESALRTGWGRGALAAVVVFAGLFVLNLILGAIEQSGPDAVELAGERFPVPDTDLGDLLYGALASVYLWHGVGASVTLEALPAESGLPAGVEVSFSLALILGTFVTVTTLFLAGRWVGRRDDLPLWVRPLRGLQVALPYAALAGALSPLAAVERSIPGFSQTTIFREGAPPFEIDFSLFGAIAMPFLLAVVAAGAGAMGSVARTVPGFLRRAAAAAAGGWRMLWLSVALAVVGFLVVAAVHPDQTRAYFEFVSQDGALGILRGVLLTAFLLGNVGVFIGAAAAGSAVGVSTLGGSCTLISYLTFPTGIRENATGGAQGLADPCGALPLEFGAAPLPYLFFLLVPVVATVVGGRLAARRSGAATAADGATVGAAAGFVFAVLALAFAWLADLSYGVEFFFSVEASIGPRLAPTFFLSLLWGLAGGAVGGWIGSRGGSVTEAGIGAERAGNDDGPGLSPGPS